MRLRTGGKAYSVVAAEMSGGGDRRATTNRSGEVRLGDQNLKMKLKFESESDETLNLKLCIYIYILSKTTLLS
jgi:hypothetical protein